MTKDKKKPPRMSASEKRRSALAGLPFSSSSASTNLAATASSSRVSPSRPPSTAPRENNSGNKGGSSNIIAPPPPAQLGSASANTGSGLGDDAHKDKPAMRERDSNVSSKDTSPNSKEGRGGGGGSNGVAPDSSSPSAAATAVLLKEKHQRILQLERELDVMESEFTSELERLSHRESENATFWQGRHETVQSQLSRAQSELELLRAEAEVRNAERLELTTGWESLRRQLADREREAKDLRAQVRGLKEFVSTSTRTDGMSATSDEVFGDGMANLGNGLQNWVIVNFRKAKLDLANLSGDARQELEQLVPMHEGLSKVNLIQALVSRILVEMIFGTYYIGLSPEQSRQLRDTEAMILSLVGSKEVVNQWRAATLTMIRRESQPKCQAEADAAIEAVILRVNRFLAAVTDAQETNSRNQSLRAQLHNAADLAQLLAVQKAVFSIKMPKIIPHQQTLFHPATMEDMGGEDEDFLAQREVLCVTFPGIIKYGDENGNHLQYHNVISKARVFCSPE